MSLEYTSLIEIYVRAHNRIAAVYGINTIQGSFEGMRGGDAKNIIREEYLRLMQKMIDISIDQSIDVREQTDVLAQMFQAL